MVASFMTNLQGVLVKDEEQLCVILVWRLRLLSGIKSLKIKAKCPLEWCFYMHGGVDLIYMDYCCRIIWRPL